MKYYHRVEHSTLQLQPHAEHSYAKSFYPKHLSPVATHHLLHAHMIALKDGYVIVFFLEERKREVADTRLLPSQQDEIHVRLTNFASPLIKRYPSLHSYDGEFVCQCGHEKKFQAFPYFTAFFVTINKFSPAFVGEHFSHPHITNFSVVVLKRRARSSGPDGLKNSMTL